MSNINDKRKVKVQQRSGFDKTYRNTLTGDCGTLIPILVDELIPDSKPNLRINLAAALPPLVSDTYMNCRVRVEAFIVPLRLCQANYQDFFCDYPVEFDKGGDHSAEGYDLVEGNGCMPLITLSVSNSSVSPWLENLTGIQSLADYFGFERSDEETFRCVIAPFVAYHMIWNEWYRNPRVQKSAFVRNKFVSVVDESDTYYEIPAGCVPYTSYYFDSNGIQPEFCGYHQFPDEEFYKLADGVNILSLRQRNFGLDYFTSAMPEPQQGEVAVVKFGQNGDPADGFSIASLRAMNSIQQFRERNGLTSPRYQQQLYARYGVAPSDGVIQRPVLVGAATYDIYSHGVVSTQSTNSPAASPNPFNGKLGSRGGNGFAGGSDFIISDFHVKEPCYLFVLASLVPEVSYSQNLGFMLRRYKGLGSITDMGNALLQNVGPQPITGRMVTPFDSDNSVFAYADRYSDFMFRNNEIHGHFKYGSDLSSFVLQRHFSDTVEFGSEFLTIPKNYLDDVLSVSSVTLGFAYWMDILFEYKVSQPLQEYAIPSLQDPGYEHGHTIVLRKNGQLL